MLIYESIIIHLTKDLYLKISIHNLMEIQEIKIYIAS